MQLDNNDKLALLFAVLTVGAASETFDIIKSSGEV